MPTRMSLVTLNMLLRSIYLIYVIVYGIQMLDSACDVLIYLDAQEIQE